MADVQNCIHELTRFAQWIAPASPEGSSIVLPPKQVRSVKQRVLIYRIRSVSKVTSRSVQCYFNASRCYMSALLVRHHATSSQIPIRWCMCNLHRKTYIVWQDQLILRICNNHYNWSCWVAVVCLTNTSSRLLISSCKALDGHDLPYGALIAYTTRFPGVWHVLLVGAASDAWW